MELNILSKEDSGDDTGDDSEYDSVEIEIRNEDGEVVDEQEVEAEIEDIIEKSASKKLRTNSQVLIPLTSSFLINSNVVSNNEKIAIYGGINKKKIQSLLKGFQNQTKYLKKLVSNILVLFQF